MADISTEVVVVRTTGMVEVFIVRRLVVEEEQLELVVLGNTGKH